MSWVDVALRETIVLGVKVDVTVGAGPSMHKQAVLTKALALDIRLFHTNALMSTVLAYAEPIS